MNPIAAIWTPKRVVAAAQKVHRIGDIYFVAAGLVDEALPVITDALESADNFRDAVSAAQENLEAPLIEAAQRIQDEQPEDFKKNLSSRNALDVFFFGKNDGAAALTHLSFATKKRGKEVVFKIQQNHFPNADTDIMSIEILTAGMGSDADKFFRNGVTGQQALVRPLQTLQKFMNLAGAPFPVQAVKFTTANVSEVEIISATVEIGD